MLEYERVLAMHQERSEIREEAVSPHKKLSSVDRNRFLADKIWKVKTFLLIKFENFYKLATSDPSLLTKSDK